MKWCAIGTAASPAGVCEQPVRQRRASAMMQRTGADDLRRQPVRQLPALRGPVPHPGAENREDATTPSRRTLTGAGKAITGDLPPGGERRRAALQPWAIPSPIPFIGIRCCINASQVTNPSIDPLREPMETQVFLGRKPRRHPPGCGGQPRRQSAAPAEAGKCR